MALWEVLEMNVVVRQKRETAQRFRKAVLLIRYVTIEWAIKVLSFEQRRLIESKKCKEIQWAKARRQ